MAERERGVRPARGRARRMRGILLKYVRSLIVICAF